MRKILIVLVMCMFMISLGSAWEWDNRGNYNADTKTMEIRNALGLGTVVSEIKLITPLDHKVPLGYQKVAEIQIINADDYNDALKQILFYDKRKNMQGIEKEFDYKVKETKAVRVKDYKEICHNAFSVKNQTMETVCSYVEDGGHFEDRTVWVELDKSVLRKGTFTIGIFTDVKLYDKVEWIPTFFNIEIDEWATWTQTLSVDLQLYYNFDESAGFLVEDVATSNFNGTLFHTNNSNWVTGKINNGLFLNGIKNFVNTTFRQNYSLEDNFTMNFWYNTNNSVQGAREYFGTIGNDNSAFGVEYIAGLKAKFRIRDNTGQVSTPTSTSNVNTGVWIMQTLVRDTARDVIELYINGVSEDNFTDVTLTNIDFLDEAMYLGVRNNKGTPVTNTSGTFDEMGIWNRSLGIAEVVQLYNGGDGITFQESIVTLNSPADDFNSNVSLVQFNCTTDPEAPTLAVNLSLIIDNAINETVTFGSPVAEATEVFDRNISQGSHTWNCQSTTDGGDLFNGSQRSFSVDSIPPVIQIIHPIGNEGINAVGLPQDLNWSINDSNLDICWYNYDGTNVTVTCSANSTTFILEDDNLNLTFYANDTFGNLNSVFTNWSYSFFESSITFNSSAFETSTQEFILNITTLPDILTVDAILNYNGTRFTAQSDCESGACTISTSIDIPLVITGESENKSFFFEITGFNATSSFSANSSTRNQNVSRIHLEQCNPTFVNQTLNFTAFDEQTLDSVDPFSFNADFEYWLGTGTVIRNNNFINSSTASVQLCISPSNFTYNVNGVVEYDEAGTTNYTIRNYYFQNDQLNNISEHIGLGLLLADESTTFILKVQDADILPLPNVLIFTERFYPGDGEFLVVQVAKTDDNGKSVGFFEAETGDYRFIIKQDGEVLLITPQDNRSQKVVGEEVPFTLTFTVGEDEGASWEIFEPADNLVSNLTYNSLTQIISFAYIDTSADFNISFLQVFKVNATGNDGLICNNNLTQSSGIISCNMTGNSTGNYIAKGIIFRGDTRTLTEQIIFTIETFTTLSGRLGLFLGWFVILICAFAFKFNEIAGIILTNIAMIFVNMIGLLNFGITWITAWVAISLIIIVVLER